MKPLALLFLLLAGYGWAAPAIRNAGGHARAPIHPLLLGSLSDPNGSLTRSLMSHAWTLAIMRKDGALGPGSARTALVPLLDGPPLDRISAGVLIRVMAEPGMTRGAAATLAPAFPALGTLAALFQEKRAEPGTALGSLLAVAQSDPEVRYVFDGSLENPPLELENLRMRRGTLRAGHRRLPLAAPSNSLPGYAHPSIAGAVIHIPRPASRRRRIFQMESAAEGSSLLAHAGAGPRVLAHGRVGGAPVLIKERVFGKTLSELIRDGLFGAAERALVAEMLARMANRGLAVPWLSVTDIWLGTTLLDPVLRSYALIGEWTNHVEGDAPRADLMSVLEERMRESIRDAEALARAESL